MSAKDRSVGGKEEEEQEEGGRRECRARKKMKREKEMGMEMWKVRLRWKKGRGSN